MPTLKGKWYFKEVINDVPDLEEVEFHFSNSGYTYETIGLWPTSDNLIGFGMLNGDGHVVYSKEAQWADTQYRAIDIIGTQEVSEDFYNWFTKNAVNLQPTGTWRFNKTLTEHIADRWVSTTADSHNTAGLLCKLFNGEVSVYELEYDYSGNYICGYDNDNGEYYIWNSDDGWLNEEARIVTFYGNIVQLDPEFAFWFYENAHSMELKLYSECYIAETADKIRDCANNNTLTFKVSELAEGVQIAYDAGYSQGIAENDISLQTKTVSPSSTSQTVRPDSGYDGLSSVTVHPCSGTVSISSTAEVSVVGNASARISPAERGKIIPSNIKSGVDILGVTGTYSGSAPQTCTVELYISADQGANCEIHYMNEDGTFATYFSLISTNPGYKTINLTVQRNSLLALCMEKTRSNFRLSGSDGDGGLQSLQMISKTTGMLSQGIAIYKVLNKDYAREELVFTN